MREQYAPDKVWTMNEDNGGKFASINRPTAGSRKEQSLPVGEHPFQLYSMGTPNGVKVTIMLEELLEAGFSDAEYDAFLINIAQGDQFTSGFVGVNPNSKIPALIDKSDTEPLYLFESGSILLHLAEKFDCFLSKKPSVRALTLNWLFWQVGSAPYVGGGFGHFYHYAPEKIKYPIDRFTMETKRQLDLLNKHLEHNTFMAGDEYSIADMAIFPWYGYLVKGKIYDAAEFLAVHEYKNLLRWADHVLTRPAVLRGRLVNNFWGDKDQVLRERHSSNDFETLDLEFR